MQCKNTANDLIIIKEYLQTTVLKRGKINFFHTEQPKTVATRTFRPIG